METAKRITILLAVVILTIAAAQSSEKPAETKTTPTPAVATSNTRSASCLVKVTCDPTVLDLNFENTIRPLLFTSGVLGKAVREVFNLPTDIFPPGFLEVEELSYDTGIYHYDEAFQPSQLQRGGYGVPPVPSATTTPPDDLLQKTGFKSSDQTDPAVKAPIPPAPKPAQPGRTPAYSPYGGYGYGGPGRYGGGYGVPGEPSYYGSRAGQINIQQPPETEQSVLFQIKIDLSKIDSDIKPAAEELMQAIVTNLRENLLRLWGEQRMRLDSQEKTAQEEAERSEKMLGIYQQELRTLAGSRNLSRAMILSRCDSLRNMLEAAQMDMASDELMLKSIGEQIAQTMNKLDAQTKEDSVTDELKRILQIQTEQCDRVQKLQTEGRASSAEVADVAEKLARARIELAQRREQLNKAAGGDKISSLNNRLADLSLKITQADAQRKRFEEQLSEAEELLTKADTYEVLSLKADLERQNLQQTLVWRDAISRQIRMLQEPLVSVIGGQ